MLKIYLKGFEMPYAVFGRKLFEDERFFVVEADGIQSRIPWKNILYIESVVDIRQADEDVAPSPTPPAAPPLPEQPKVPPMDVESQVFLSQKMQEAIARAKSMQAADSSTDGSGDDKELNIVFSGYKQKTFRIAVPATVPTNEYSAQLSKEIFNNAQVKAFLGDFVLSGKPKVDGDNVIIDTAPLQEKINPLKEKLDMTTQFLSKVMKAPDTKKMPSLGLDSSFAMTGSPFNTTVSLQDD